MAAGVSEWPAVGADGKVTFRFRAPGARDVKVSGQFGPDVPLQKGEDGTWTGSTGPVAGGVYEYRMVVDGQPMLDSSNPWIKPQRQPGSSILHVPSDPPAPWDLAEVPHGTLHQHAWHSKALKALRHVVVYTPPSWKPGGEPLPVLCLSHGYSDNEQTWTVHGKAHWILDNLIAQGKAVPMVVVMPDGHALPPPPTRRDGYMGENSEAYCRELLTDVLPLVEATYGTRRDARGRAFAGLSMGGRHALTLALRHADVFAAIGAFSAAPPETEGIGDALQRAADLNAKLQLLWIACGRDDFLFAKNEAFHEALTRAGIRHDHVVTDGDHSWPVWRRYLVDFAPRLFRP